MCSGPLASPRSLTTGIPNLKAHSLSTHSPKAPSHLSSPGTGVQFGPLLAPTNHPWRCSPSCNMASRDTFEVATQIGLPSSTSRPRPRCKTSISQHPRPSSSAAMDDTSFFSSRRTAGRPLSAASVDTPPSAGSPSASSDAWWEPLIARGHLSERLRRAHEPLSRHTGRPATAASPSTSNHFAFPSQSETGESSRDSQSSLSSSFSRRTARLAAARETFSEGRPRYQSMNAVDALAASNKGSLPARAAFQHPSQHRFQPQPSSKEERRHSSVCEYQAPESVKASAVAEHLIAPSHYRPDAAPSIEAKVREAIHRVAWTWIATLANT